MNMVVKSAEVECRGSLKNSGMQEPSIRAFMDDLTVTTTSVMGCRWILQGLEHLLKPAKSRSLVVKRGTVREQFCFSGSHLWREVNKEHGQDLRLDLRTQQHSNQQSLLVYDVPMTTVKCFERKVSRFFRGWAYHVVEKHCLVREEQAKTALQLSDGGVYVHLSKRGTAVSGLMRLQSLFGRHRSENWQEVEGSRGSQPS